jgi:acetyl esterase/lipase
MYDLAIMERSIDVLTRPQPAAGRRLRYGAFASQFADLRLPVQGAGPFPVVVGIHGGWWRAAHGLETHAHLCAALTAAGFATWNIEYRRIGEAGGGWPGTLEDVGAAVDFLPEIASAYRLDLSRVVTVGFSAGGQLALWAAGRHRLPPGNPLRVEAPIRLKGAISLAGAVDLARCAEQKLSQGIVETFLGGDPAQVPRRYTSASPLALLPLGVPQTLIHGTEDTSVPHDISRRYHAAAVARGDICELLSLPGVQHFELIDPLSAAWQTIHRAVLART